MKKLLLIIILLVLIIIGSIYLFIPSQLKVSQSKYIDCPSLAAIRAIHNTSNWSKWWPADSSTNKDKRSDHDSLFHYKNNIYKLSLNHEFGVDLNISNQNFSCDGRISCLSAPSDSSILYWQTVIPASSNPFKRLFQYFEATSLKANMTYVLDSLGSFLENESNIYGYVIRRATLKDSLVMVTRATTTFYPDTRFIYGLMDQLKAYISSQGARTTSYPMLNVSNSTKNQFETMVAFATDKKIVANDQFFTKFFQRNKDKVLTTEVRGGTYAISAGHKAIDMYLQDHQISTPVIPFEYLVTDRRMEPDTSRWVTIINYPVF